MQEVAAPGVEVVVSRCGSRAAGPGPGLPRGPGTRKKKKGGETAAAAAAATAAAEDMVAAGAGTGKQGRRPDQGFWAQVNSMHAHLLEAREPPSDLEDDASSHSTLGAATATPRKSRPAIGGRKR